MESLKGTTRLAAAASLAFAVALSANTGRAQGTTTFTYQGSLTQAGAPADGTFDFEFGLYEDPSAANLIGTVFADDVTVTRGVFTVGLDFGNQFTGDTRWLGIGVRPGADTGAYTALSPLVELTPSPYALYALGAYNAVTAAKADDANLLDGMDSSEFDADSTNELNTGFALSGTELQIGDAWGTRTVELSSILPADDQTLEEVLTSGDDAGGLDAVNLGRVGVGTAAPTEALHVDAGNLIQTAGDPVVVGRLGIGPTPLSVFVAGRYAYVTQQIPNRLDVIDVSDPTAPALVGSLGFVAAPRSVYVAGRYAYVLDDGKLKVIDLSDPAAPALAGTLTIGDLPLAVHVSGRYAYVVDSDSADLKAIDVSDPAAPALVGSLLVGPFPRSVYVSGRYAYVVEADFNDLQVIDVSDPAAPALVGSVGIGPDAQSVRVSGRYAYVVGAGSDVLQAIDVSDPAAPALAGSLGIGAVPRSVFVSGRYAYVVDNGSDDLKTIDVSDPSAPVLAGSLGIGGTPVSVFVSGRYAYVVDQASDDLKVIDVSGGETTSLMAHSLEAGSLQVRDGIVAHQDISTAGGLTVGQNALVSGGLGVDRGISTGGGLTVGQDAIVSGGLDVGAGAVVAGQLDVGAGAVVAGRLSVAASVSGPANFAATIRNTADADHSGGLLIRAGQTAHSAAFDRMLRFERPDGTEIGAVRQITSNTVDYFIPSDERLKTNFAPASRGLHDLMAIEVRDYEYRDEPGVRQTGFVAQQLNEHYPAAVSPGGDDPRTDPWMVNYGRVTPLLVEAMQEQQRTILSQRKEIEELRERVDALESLRARLASLENALDRLKADGEFVAGGR